MWENEQISLKLKRNNKFYWSYIRLSSLNYKILYKKEVKEKIIKKVVRGDTFFTIYNRI